MANEITQRFRISRRGFLDNMKNTGITVAAAELVLSSLNEAQAPTQTQAPPPASAATAGTAAPVKSFTGTGGACFAEQLIGCGVK